MVTAENRVTNQENKKWSRIQRKNPESQRGHRDKGEDGSGVMGVNHLHLSSLLRHFSCDAASLVWGPNVKEHESGGARVPKSCHKAALLRCQPNSVLHNRNFTKNPYVKTKRLKIFKSSKIITNFTIPTRPYTFSKRENTVQEIRHERLLSKRARFYYFLSQTHNLTPICPPGISPWTA